MFSIGISIKTTRYRYVLNRRDTCDDVSKLMILVCNYKEAHKEGNYFFPLIETGGYEGMHWVSV